MYDTSSGLAPRLEPGCSRCKLRANAQYPFAATYAWLRMLLLYGPHATLILEALRFPYRKHVAPPSSPGKHGMQLLSVCASSKLFRVLAIQIQPTSLFISLSQSILCVRNFQIVIRQG